MSYGNDDFLDWDGETLHYGLFYSAMPFFPASCLFLNLHSVPFILVKSLSKSDKKLGSYKTFRFCSAETFMVMTSTVVDCFNPLFIVTCCSAKR